jgi:CRP-like cAMP-binding protein
MSTMDPADIPIFAALEPKDRDEILGYARRRSYGPGDVIVREGDRALNLYIVIAGQVRIELAGVGQVSTRGPGEFFGEYGLLGDHGRTATVIADDEVTCLLLPAWEFRSLLDEHPKMAVPMLHEIIERTHPAPPTD